MIFEQTVVLSDPFDDALAQVKDAFMAQGFGTLTEIDLQATLAAKVGAELDRYVIVGACNPGLASQAVAAEPQIGVLLPCNVVVRQVDGAVVVEAMDAGMMASMTGNPDLEPIADEARRLIANALNALADS